LSCGLCLLFCAFAPPALRAEQANGPPVWRYEEGRLLAGTIRKFNVWQQGFFRIKFTREGEHAVPPEDLNNNGCPDFAENVARQLMVAHYVFCVLNGFLPPLESPRYAGARYVDVGIYGRSKVKGAGVNFDEPGLAPDFAGLTEESARETPAAALPKARILSMGISRDIHITRNSTPAHEYFHHIQNGMNRFKNSWFYEGMARWSQDSLDFWKTHGKGGKNPLELLDDPQAVEELVALAYKAADVFWAPLARHCAEGSAPLPADDPVLNLTYVDGTPIMKDKIFIGARMMLAVLQEMGAAEGAAFTALGYESWTEANQRNPGNNAFILESARTAAGKICPRQATEAQQH
jgi:hypothetical protein